ncbi:MAG TPA: right-handed parallel beta-helix repeat-containing protein [Caulobacteraceae bacterium]|nr:right-handed parallel beta-helix repeat-containing protein [Caulobacteraceae bacterium]
MRRRLFVLCLSGALLQLGVAASANAAPDPFYPGCDQGRAGQQRVMAADPESLPRILSTAKAGDEIQLASGAYGAVKLTGDNAAFVTVTNRPGQTPRLASLEISGGHWRVSGLTIVGFAPPALGWDGWQRHDALVKVVQAKNVLLSGNVVASTEDAPSWEQEKHGVTQSDALSDGIDVLDSTCVSVSDNRIKNVFNGLVAVSDQSGDQGRRILITGNQIDDFAGDGVDHSVSEALIQRNLITDAHNVCDSLCIHQDGIQGWNSVGKPKVVSRDIVIDGNTIIRVARPNLPRPSSALQGITIFDGNWSNLQVTNNIVVVNVWHGITLFGPKSAYIVNNTVVGDSANRTWIMVAPQKEAFGGGAPDHVIVANNIAMDFRFASTGLISLVGIAPKDNYTTFNPRDTFRTFDPKAARFDLHIRHPHGELEGGRMTPPAERDIDGTPRSARTELGAYASSSMSQ